MTSYRIADDGRSITCRRCGKTSYNMSDVAHRYCGHCKVFHDDEWSTVEIAGVPVTVVSDDEAHLADFVVCIRADSSAATDFDDNETGVCSRCSTAIVFRPYIPKGPPRICLPCAIALAEKKGLH
jgi:ribosomal protein L37E